MRHTVRMRCCIVATLVLPGAVITPAQAADRVYWANAAGGQVSAIALANLDGSSGAPLAAPGAPPGCCPFGTAIDVAAGRIYWGSDGGPVIAFANLDGSGAGALNTAGATATGDAIGVAIDPAGGRIYWANGGADKISFARLDGSGGGDLSTSGANIDGPRGVAIDPAAGRVYWSNSTGSRISFANLDGSLGGNLDITGATNAGSITGVAIDPVGRRIYWASDNANKISSAKLDGTGGGADLATTGATVVSPFGLAIDPVARRVYWTNYNNQSLGFAALDGSGGGTVAVTGTTPDAPNFPSLLRAPDGAGAPVVSGGALTGADLSCTTGTWAPDAVEAFFFRAPRTIAHAWSVDGTPIAGATASTLRATAPGSYRCTVTATNPAGSASQASAPHVVTAPAGPPTGGIPPRPAVAPVLSGLKLSPAAFRATTGATVSFRLDIAASVALTVSRETVGRRAASGRCVARTQANRRRRSCTRRVAVPGRITRAAIAGTNRFRFTGRIGGRTLAAGRYRLTATPTAGGKAGTARSAAFRILTRRAPA